MLNLTSFNLSVNEANVFKYFEEISKIPRGSGDMIKIADYCEEFAKNLNLKYVRDQYNNVVIFKDASKGFENSKPIILQGHLDIVCQKTDDCDIDFLKDGLKIYCDGDFIKAEGTTLGADNGIAVAFILTILASNDIAHPPIEAVLTTDEEIGLIGAGGLDKSILTAKSMINIDSEEDNVLTVSCAGGQDVVFKIPVTTTKKDGTVITISIGGLLGGHSGVEIHKGRTNANMLLGKFLKHLDKNGDISLISVTGGTKSNAIPNSATAVVCCQNPENLLLQIENFKTLYFGDIKTCEPNLFIETKKDETTTKDCLSDELKARIITLLTETPDGVIKMSEEIEGLVETSLNLGILTTENDSLIAHFALRSNKEASLHELTNSIVAIGKKLNAKTETNGFYPPWEYNPVSHLRELYKKCYKNQNGEEIKVEAIHAGLECAVFSSAVNGLDCISIGPNIYDVHTVNEKLDILSTMRTFKLLLKVLEEYCSI
jgi:dipeptidase D